MGPHDLNRFSVEGYEKLAEVLLSVATRAPSEAQLDVLADAFDQAARGKGRERHGKDAAWHLQPIFSIPALVGEGMALGQALKKMDEQQRLPWVRGRAECLGAIVYLSAAAVRAADRDIDDDQLPLVTEPRLRSITELICMAVTTPYHHTKVDLLVDVLALVSQYVTERDAEELIDGAVQE